MRISRRIEPAGQKVFVGSRHAPYAIRWFGITSLFGHSRHFAASAIASESIDARDWMRPEEPERLLQTILGVFGKAVARETLVQTLDRPVVIDFVADTGDDRDVSRSVAEMIFRDYEFEDGGTVENVSRGDILLFGGDTAYPVATAEEIYRRVIEPWNEVLAELPDDRPRVLLGIPGNHDWFDGADGFARLFRKELPDTPDDELPRSRRSDELGDALRPSSTRANSVKKGQAFVERQLHIDEVKGFFALAKQIIHSVTAFFAGGKVKRRKRLSLIGYESVQESTYWALPLAPGLDLWGLDRQLRDLDYRQRTFFQRVRDRSKKLWIIAPDPARAYGEEHAIGERMLKACALSLETDELFYLTGDVHHYERRREGARSLHVIAGGGGAFVHGTRISPWPGRPSEHTFPSREMSLWLVLQVPLKLALGKAGFLVHCLLALMVSLELTALPSRGYGLTGITMPTIYAVLLYFVAGHHRKHNTKVALLAAPFGLLLGLLPAFLYQTLRRPPFVHWIPHYAGNTAVILLHAFVGAFLFGLFLMILALTGWEHQQAFSVLAHPGFKHFVRLRVSVDGTIRGWVVGKTDPLVAGPPTLIDTFSWPF